MVRYKGEPLRQGSRVAVVANDALGNFYASTPLVRGLATATGRGVTFVSGPRTAELALAHEHIESTIDFLGSPPHEFAQRTKAEMFDLVVNIEDQDWARCATAILAKDAAVCGPSLGPDGRGTLPFADDEKGRLAADPCWVATDLQERYPFLESGWIGEIFYRLAYLSGPCPHTNGPRALSGKAVPDVLLATAASLTEKLWPIENWIGLAKALTAGGRSVGLLGAAPAAQAKFWHGAGDEQLLLDVGVCDLRGAFTLPQVVGAIAESKLLVTLDNGVMHAGCTTQTPVVALFREGIHRLWAPPSSNLSVVVPYPGEPVASVRLETVLSKLSF